MLRKKQKKKLKNVGLVGAKQCSFINSLNIPKTILNEEKKPLEADDFVQCYPDYELHFCIYKIPSIPDVGQVARWSI